MSAKLHKTVRLDADLAKRIELLQLDNEPLSSAMCRILAAGCDTLEGKNEHEPNTDEHNDAPQEPDKSTQKLIEHLEREIERLMAEHKADRQAIAEKDKQIATALEKAHELTEQTHVLLGMTSEVKVIPANKPDPSEEPTNNQPEVKQSWFARWFGM